MRTLTYWVSECLTDSKAYTIRTRTRRDAVAKKAEDDPSGERYGPVTKVSVEYSDALDLLIQCMGEGGGYWEAE